MDFPWIRILPLVGRAFLEVFAQPFFWLVILLVWYLYRRLQQTREALYGVRGGTGRLTAFAVVYGLLGGLAGSYIMILFGVSLNDVGVGYLWLLALVLMLFHPRFLCFSYSGGLLALISLLTGHPRVNVPSLMGLVAVLHLVESGLILLSGHADPLPVYVRHGTGRVVGAFNLQKFWPVPLAVLMLVPSHQLAGEAINTPGWWPLLHLPGVGPHLAYGIFPVVAALGYGELAVSRLPRERARRSALHLALFSLVLLTLAVWASRAPGLAVLPAVFSPLGHELVIYLGRREELHGRPRFAPPPRGVLVLEVIPGSPAAAAGLRAGAVLYQVGEFSVNSRYELEQALRYAGNSFMVQYTSGPGGFTRRVQVRMRDSLSLGLIPGPEPGEPPNVSYLVESPLRNLGRRLWKG